MGDLTTLAKLKVYLTLPPSWVKSTTYAVGDQARANSNLYQCITQGSSASSGTGPSGTTADITDGTAHWKFLNASVGGDDATLSRLISAVSAFFSSYCCRTFEDTDWIYTISGNGSRSLLLPEYPVSTLDSVTIDGVTVPARANVGAYGYVLSRPNKVLLDGGGYFTRGIANVAVSFAAGYTTIPDDLEGACIETCGSWYRRRQRIDEKSKSLSAGGEVISFAMDEVPTAARAILDTYRRHWQKRGDLVAATPD